MRIIMMAIVLAALTGCAPVPASAPQLSPLDTGLTKGGASTPTPAGCDLRPRDELVLLLRRRLKLGVPEKPLVRVAAGAVNALVDCDRRFSATVRIYVGRDERIGGAK